jgi:hypothetical protein
MTELDSLKSVVDALSKEIVVLEKEAEIAAAAKDAARLQEIQDRLGAIWKQCMAKLTDVREVIEQRIAAAKAGDGA